MKRRREVPSGHQFWDFSLKIYSAEGVAGECLTLQDKYGADVNVLLFCAFLGARGIELKKNDIEAIIAFSRPWHVTIVKSLRNARRGSKTYADDPEFKERKSVAVFRAKIKALELSAERIEHDMLESWTDERGLLPVHSKRTSAISNNISLYVKYLRAPPKKGAMRRLIASARLAERSFHQ